MSNGLIDEKAFKQAEALFYLSHVNKFRRGVEAYEAAKAVEQADIYNAEPKLNTSYTKQPAGWSPVKDDKLIALLEELSCLGNGDMPGNSIGNVMAQQALEMAKNPPYATIEREYGGLGKRIDEVDSALGFASDLTHIGRPLKEIREAIHHASTLLNKINDIEGGAS